MILRLASLLVILLLLPASAMAQELRVFVVTIGPGALPYERYGHNALLFADQETGGSVAFDWGRFDFDEPGFIGRFVRGEMLYSSGASDGAEILDVYTNLEGRAVVLQELNVTQEQALAMLRACEIGYLPQNRYYTYDYFLANCSTRLRDVIDEVLGGQIHAQIRGIPVGTTFRREGERHMTEHWWLWLGFHAGLGKPADRPIDAWEHTFLPSELRTWLGRVQIEGPDGEAVPLVRREVVLSEGIYPLPPPEPPNRWWQTGLIGLVLAGAMLFLGRLRNPVPARLAAAAWFLFAGFCGTFMLAVWAFTGHWGSYANQITLLLSPLGLLVGAALLIRRWRYAAPWLAAAHLALALVAVLLHVIPGLGQDNLAAITLALPVTLAAAWIAGVRPGRRRAEHLEPRPARGAVVS